MGNDRILYEAESFLADYRSLPVDKRLAFDAWADRKGFQPDLKRRLWRTIKSLSRQRR
ncbi:MAG: hypothetical protein Kow0092_30950 [Deferrisomatales bacterium]